jgi:hypothetical protein
MELAGNREHFRTSIACTSARNALEMLTNANILIH